MSRFCDESCTPLAPEPRPAVCDLDTVVEWNAAADANTSAGSAGTIASNGNS